MSLSAYQGRWIDLSVAAVVALDQLFVDGPQFDSKHDITYQHGRAELVAAGFAFKWNGWVSISSDGLNLAIHSATQMQSKLGNRWYKKATGA
jgi:hypothetical protein